MNETMTCGNKEGDEETMVDDSLVEDSEEKTIVDYEEEEEMLDLETMDKIMNEEATDFHEAELEKFKVFADVECQLDETNTFISTPICYTREDEDEIHYHWGRD